MTGLSARAVIFAKRLRTEFDLFLLSLDRNLLEYGLPQKVRRVSLIGKRILSSGKRILLRLHRNLGRAKPTSIQTPQNPSHGAEMKKIVIEFAPRPRNNLPVNTANSVPPLPIVFIHYKNKDYLKFSLAQAKVSNPHSTVYLLGDSSNNCYDFVEHHYFSDYFEGAAKFSKIYRHFNTTSPYYSLFDFQRWFILREFLRAQKLDRCLYLDSDTMLYAELSKEQKKFERSRPKRSFENRDVSMVASQ